MYHVAHLLGHSCTLSSAKKKSGDLLITSNNFVFDTFPLIPSTVGEMVSLKLRDITVLKKVKVNMVFDAICVVMQDGSVQATTMSDYFRN